MRLAVMSSDAILEAFTARWGHPDGDAARAELVRAEVTARGGGLRRGVLRRVALALASASRGGEGGEVTRLGAICAALEAEGDLVAGAGGWLSPTPLRLVALSDDRYRVVCSLPSHRLSSLLPGEATSEMPSRGMSSEGGSAEGSNRAFAAIRRSLYAPDRAALAEAVAPLGGTILEPAAWAGLDRAPVADGDWLDRLDRRLGTHAVPAGTTERDGPLDWRARVVTDEGFRWRREAAEARLWRGRGAAGRRRWAWCPPGGGPARVAWLPLRADEAHRAAFALARRDGGGAPVTVHRADATAEVDFGAWLPWAEYRFLSLLAVPVRDGARVRWRVPIAQLERVTDTLADRLGVVFGDGVAT